MPADLKSKSSLQRSSVILTPTGLVKLEHAYTQDRVYRCDYSRIQSIVMWSRVPPVRTVMAVVLLLISSGGVLLAIAFHDTASLVTASIFGGVVFLIGAVLLYRYLAYKFTTIRIMRNGSPLEIEGIFPPRKLSAFRDTLLARVRISQPAPAPIPLPTAEPRPFNDPGAYASVELSNSGNVVSPEAPHQ